MSKRIDDLVLLDRGAVGQMLACQRTLAKAERRLDLARKQLRDKASRALLEKSAGARRVLKRSLDRARDMIERVEGNQIARGLE